MIMTNDRCEQVERIFFDAMQRDSASSREQFLKQACKDDPSLRHEVEALLEAKSAPDSFLDRPLELGETTGGDLNDCRMDEGQIIGRYKLLQQLGEGGFGVVYMAEQSIPVRRKVALKLIKPGMDSKEVIARFESERQALALMDHPNIAKVLDAGTTDSGRPYFVMDLVKGGSLVSYCDENNLPTRERLDLFMQVCRAVQHAHQKGIIHRDLKPANVMVTFHDGVPVPKVIDFGVSKALSQQLTEKTLFTRYGQIIGTPQYMSPEQAEMSGLDVDTRSDIYSLGVLLYELLTGRPPFDSESLQQAGLDEMRRMIREEEPLKPSTRLKTLNVETASAVSSHRSSSPEALQKAVMGDLDWIVMKSLEKDRNRRYETAGNLVDDIERHLDDEPVMAGPPTIRYQLAKVFRRHRAAALTATAISAALIVGLVASTIAWNRTLIALAETEEAVEVKDEALTRESQQKQIALNNAKEAKLQAEKAKVAADNAEQSLKLVKNLLGHAGPSINRGKDATVLELLDEFAERLGDSPPETKVVELEVRFLLAEAYKGFSEATKAKNEFAMVEELGRDAHDNNPVELGRFLLRLGLNSNNDNCEDILLEALQLAQENKDLAPDEITILCELARLNDWDDRKKAERYYRNACDRVEVSNKEYRAKLKVNPYRHFASFLKGINRQLESEAMTKLAIAFAKDLRTEAEHIETLLMSGKITEAHELALKIGNPSLIARTINKRIDFEYEEVTTADERREVVLRFKNEVVSNWPLLHSAEPAKLLGNIISKLVKSDLEEGALEINALANTLAPHVARQAYVGAAHSLRRAGELAAAARYYKRGAGDSWWDGPWLARCHSAARSFQVGKALIEGTLDNRGGDEVGELWIKCEAAIFAAALDQPALAKQLFAESFGEFREHQKISGIATEYIGVTICTR